MVVKILRFGKGRWKSFKTIMGKAYFNSDTFNDKPAIYQVDVPNVEYSLGETKMKYGDNQTPDQFSIRHGLTDWHKIETILGETTAKRVTPINPSNPLVIDERELTKDEIQHFYRKFTEQLEGFEYKTIFPGVGFISKKLANTKKQIQNGLDSYKSKLLKIENEQQLIEE